MVKHILSRGLAVLIAALALTACAPTPPATAAMLKPALAASQALRPVWDGHHPERWTGTDAMCPATSARLHRWARTGPGAPWFRVECLPDGPHEWAWNAIVKSGAR